MSDKKKLTQKEINDYVEKWQKESDNEALEILVTKNLGLVIYIAKKYIANVDFEDLKSIGSIGLIEAIYSFNTSKDVKFSSYAYRCIENKILMYLRKIKKIKNEVSYNSVVSHSKDGDDLTLQDMLGTDHDSLEKEVLNDIKKISVTDIMSCLTQDEKYIIAYFYGIDCVQKSREEIANDLGISTTYVTMKKQNALIKMRYPKNTRKLKDFFD